MKLLEFAHIVEKLKKLKRTGWEKRKIPHAESVADHSFRLAILAMFLAPKFGVEQNKVIQMSLLHDLGEAEIGDIIIEGQYSTSLRVPKITKEREALLSILSTVNAEQYIQLFDEFTENKTDEAKFVHQLDKLEAAIQAYEYEKEYAINLQEFFDTTKTHLDFPYLQEVLKHIEQNRKATK